VANQFFANEVHFSAEANTPIKAYIELANQIKVRFLHVHPYFERLGNSMIIWTRIWDQVARGVIKPIPSRQSDDAMKKFTAINLHTSSNASMSVVQNDELSTMFPILGKDRDLTVTPDDVSIGHKWKTYLFPVEKNGMRMLCLHISNELHRTVSLIVATKRLSRVLVSLMTTWLRLSFSRSYLPQHYTL